MNLDNDEQGQFQALRSGRWKLLFPQQARTRVGQAPKMAGHQGSIYPLPEGLALYDLEADLGETKYLASDRPEVVQQLRAKAESKRAELEDRLQKRIGQAIRPASVANP